MFNLETAIAEWRRQMRAAGIKTPVPLEELENHLREDFDAQTRTGAAPERAFEVAASRLGLPAAIQKEFGKIGEVMKPWERKMNRVVSGGAAIVLGLGGLVLLSAPLRTHAEMSHAEAVEIASVGGALLCAAVVLGVWPVLWRFFPVVLRKPMRMALALLCCVLSGACASILLRVLSLRAGTMEEIIIAMVWTLTVPLSIAAAFIFALEEAAYRNARRMA